MPVIYMSRCRDDAKPPVAATLHSACMDVHACIGEDLVMLPGDQLLIPTGFNMCCDPGYRIAMYPRSGLAAKDGVTLSNCVGVIDADYRQEVMVPLINLGKKPVVIKPGMRIAQMALEKLVPTNVLELNELPPTESNRDGGFGSTGK